MATLAPRRIPNVVLGLSLFWGGVLSAFFWTNGFNFKFLLPWSVAICAGVWVAHERSKDFKRQILARLKYRENARLPVADRGAFLNSDKGVFSTLGPIPFHELPLPRLQSYSFADLLLHCPPELLKDNAFVRISGKFLNQSAREKNGAHLAVFDALAMTMLHPANVKVPAGIDRHGGRSLLSHSLLVAGLMFQRAPAYVYMPTHGMAAIDINFKLDALDPLIPIVAMAHDLGKIRKMVLDDSGKATALLPGHGQQASRDIAALQEFWSAQISIEDRRIIQWILAYSGRVANTPIQRAKGEGVAVVTSDRLHALMGLLGECDRLAGAIEMGGAYQFDEPPKAVATQAQVEEAVDPVNLLNALAKYFAMNMPVNARSPMRSVGFKCKDAEFSRDRHVVIIDELEFVKSFSQHIEKPELNSRDGKSSALTKRVLELLDENNFLFRIDEGPNVAKRPATSCLYKIEFRDASKPEADPALVLSSSFIVDVTDWPGMIKLQNYPNCLSIPKFAGFRLGRQPAKTRRSADDSIAAESLGGEVQPVGMDLGVLLENRKSKKSAHPARVIQKIGEGLFNRTIKVAAADEKALAIVGSDDFFRDLGLAIEHYETLPESRAALGILQITRSIKNPETHVVRLDKAVYQKFAAFSLAQ